MHSDPSGTHVQTTSQNIGEPAIQETRRYDSEGRQILEDGRILSQGARVAGRIQGIEEVEDDDTKKWIGRRK